MTSTAVQAWYIILITLLMSDVCCHHIYPDNTSLLVHSFTEHSVHPDTPTKLSKSDLMNDLSWRDSYLKTHPGMQLEESDKPSSFKKLHQDADETQELAVEDPRVFEVPKKKIPERPGYIGTRIVLEDYPYVATIWLRYEKPEYRAVGTLVSPRHVLTAAHSICWSSDSSTPIPFNNLMIGVRVGTVNKMESFVEHDVLFSYIHWKWWASTRRNRLYDIAIIELTNQVQLTPRSGLVKLISPQDLDLGTLMKVSSRCFSVWWGHQVHHGRIDPYYPYLEAAEMKLITFTECHRLLSKYNDEKINTSLEICTSTKYIEGPCQGNSGGPLICEGKQVGVLSWGASCFKNDQPQIFTRVDVLYSWIKAQISSTDQRLLKKDQSSSVAILSPSLFVIFIMVVYVFLSLLFFKCNQKFSNEICCAKKHLHCCNYLAV